MFCGCGSIRCEAGTVRRRSRLFAATVCWLVIGVAGPCWADDFNVGALPALQWWASAHSSQLGQNPDGSGTVGNGDPVGFISDLSGNGHNAVMGNAIVSGGDAYRPHLQTNVIGGNAGVLFDGSTTFSSLQSSLFDGASSLTLAFAIEAANGDIYNQYFFGSNSAAVGFVGYGNAYSGVQLANGQGISLPATRGIGISSAQGSDTTLIMIARFQANGESDLWENGQLVSSSSNTSASAVGQFVQSPNAKLLGNINYGSPTGPPVAPQSTATKLYFLEGMATTSALSNDQVSQLYGYLSQQWPGVQDLEASPNLYWDKSQNPQRAVATTVNAGHIQGVAIGDNQRFVFHTAMIEEYDSNWRLITNNQSIAAGIYPSGASVHCGDGAYAAGKIFAGLEQDLAGVGATIAVYDATKPGLPLITSKSIATPQHELSGLAVVPSHGSSGIIYASSFEPNSGGDKLWMYDYAWGNVLAPNFGSFLGTLELPATVLSVQGVAWKAPYFYFSDGNNSTIQRVLYQNGVLSTQSEAIWTAPTTVQGLGFDGGNLLQVLQSGSTTEPIWTLTSAKFATPMTTGAGAWNFNGDNAYSSNAGFDGVIPNGPGSTAQFGGGTINTVNAPAVRITVDGAYTVGSLLFAPTNGTSYTLAGDNVPGHGLTLDSGNGAGASITLDAGNHAIAANIVLADAGGHTLGVGQGSTLTISGAIGESGGSRSLTFTGGGWLVLASPNSFTGGITVNNGVLQTTASGALGSGPLALNAPPAGIAAISIGGNETISALSAIVAPTGAASINLASGARLNVRQSVNTTVQGTLVTSGTFIKSGSGTLELDLAPIMLLGGSLQVNDSGTLRLNASTRSASVAAGVMVQVADSATLELAGSASALSSGGAAANRAAIVNNSTASPGILISGTSQLVGPIDGSGSVEVRAGSDLTASHIIQNALVIGGSAANLATLTIAASDSQGLPLSDPELPQSAPINYTLAGMVSSMSSLNGNQAERPTLPSTALTPSAVSLPPTSPLLLAGSGALTGADGSRFVTGGLLLVPEPSSGLLLIVAMNAAILFRRQWRLGRK
jgi:autotransporter-associated beta strand protein